MKRNSFFRSLWGRIRGGSTERYDAFGSISRPEFAAIDSHARSAPRSAVASPDSLAAYLCQPARNDVEKARAIFVWIARNVAYDVEGYRAPSRRDSSPATVLKSGKAVCSGYGNLFLHLGEAAGLRVMLIDGYAKGYGYTVGQMCVGSNHAWNAVHANDQWHLVDSTWGAGQLDHDRLKFVRQFDEYYFFTPPDQFIYSHFPEEAKWQLLPKPISKSDFEAQIHLRPYFFYTGMSADGHKKGTIEADSRLSIAFKGDDRFQWLASVLYKGRDLPADCCLAQGERGKVLFHLVLPHAGEYIARLFARRRSETGAYRWVLDYRVVAREGAPARSGFPTSYGLFADLGAFLYEPMNKYLPAGSKQLFKLRVPGARKVAVFIDKRMVEQLARKGGDVFEGEIRIARGKIEVYCNTDGENRYGGLLEYCGY